jgi:hypothetical protein
MSKSIKLETKVRGLLRRELINSGWALSTRNIEMSGVESKQAIRRRHESQRTERAQRELAVVKQHGAKLIEEFANGSEIYPHNFSPRLIPVDGGSWEALIFRFATLLWSVPVSQGYGRRMRYLVRDESNNRLVGLIALMDPVFNLRARDSVIGWDSRQRKDRLYHVMDAYVLGAVPPYDRLLGAKFVALAAASDEVRKDFARKYRGKETIIQGIRKQASLVLVTTTSALGRSSIYNRLQLPNEKDRVYRSVGFSEGWGHFHISENAFDELRVWLRSKGDPYADGHEYGSGPNWRLRTIRRGLDLLGLDSQLLRHGIKREVFLAPLASNYREFLRGDAGRPTYYHRDLLGLTEFFKQRWMIPRSERISEWREWTRKNTWQTIVDNCGLGVDFPIA